MAGNINDIRNITVAGSGTMGRGIAALFAMNGYEVCIYAISMELYEETMLGIDEILKTLVKNRFVEEGNVESLKGRIGFTDNFEESVKDTDIVIECIVEDVKIKQDFFGKLDKLCDPNVILASNTSAISITQLCENVKNKDRVIGAHFWNPPYLVPLVEIIKTEYVSEQTVGNTWNLMEKVSKKPIMVEKDVPGFVGNRMQHALFREALSIIENGIATPDDVDNAIKYGFGMRLGITAPVEVMDMGGMDLTYEIHKYLFPDLENTTKPQKILEDRMAENKLGFKSNEGIKKWSNDEIAQSRRNQAEKLIKVGKALGYYDI